MLVAILVFSLLFLIVCKLLKINSKSFIYTILFAILGQIFIYLCVFKLRYIDFVRDKQAFVLVIITPAFEESVRVWILLNLRKKSSECFDQSLHYINKLSLENCVSAAIALGLIEILMKILYSNFSVFCLYDKYLTVYLIFFLIGSFFFQSGMTLLMGSKTNWHGFKMFITGFTIHMLFNFTVLESDRFFYSMGFLKFTLVSSIIISILWSWITISYLNKFIHNIDGQ